MENKTYKDKLKNIIRQLPWLYDTENSAIVSAVNSLNHLKISKEINKFEELCKEEFSNVMIKTVEWFYDLIYAIMIDYLHKNV